ncbi:hypothetical protein GCM10009554_44310 [Kribbella koreensis]|uniref:Uncharacterized protein n=1 Tax=Kribbella koreensis TaxID=57909 RepID=A0ABP4BCZ1_9ACTN
MLVGELGRQQDLLDRHLAAEHLVPGVPDHTHTASPQEAEQPVPPSQQTTFRLFSAHPLQVPSPAEHNQQASNTAVRAPAE